jgi:glycosyltransferase involved in cell wall biosynthesis
MKTVVVSAINLYSAGPLTVAREFLAALAKSPLVSSGDCEITFFCHGTALYRDIAAGTPIRLIEKPLSRRSWIFRLFYEYVYFYWWSRRRRVDTWISLHDVTPNVQARRRMVYCHNPAPFYAAPSNWTLDPRFQVFRLLYPYVYRTNLGRNDRVIVQQQWIREIFVAKYGCHPHKVIVARPGSSLQARFCSNRRRQPGQDVSVIYPAFPRSFKNFEVLLEAMRLLGDVPLRLTLTMTGSENRYARWLVDRFGDIQTVTRMGFLAHEHALELYKGADALVFPSRLETWGLPLSEFATIGKPIFAANLPYARETLSGYDGACFFDPEDPAALAGLLRAFAVEGRFESTRVDVTYAPPCASNWDELLSLLDLA